MDIWCGDYGWVKGSPRRITEGDNFFIRSDPYGKRILIEQYEKGKFLKLIHDSSLLDYRKLNPREQLGWSREELSNNRFLLRDREHTPTLIEEQIYEGERPRECRYYSPHLLYLGHQKIFYEALADPFNGVILYDILGKPVLTKKYALLSDGSFGELLVEET